MLVVDVVDSSENCTIITIYNHEASHSRFMLCCWHCPWTIYVAECHPACVAINGFLEIWENSREKLSNERVRVTFQKTNSIKYTRQKEKQSSRRQRRNSKKYIIWIYFISQHMSDDDDWRAETHCEAPRAAQKFVQSRSIGCEEKSRLEDSRWEKLLFYFCESQADLPLDFTLSNIPTESQVDLFSLYVVVVTNTELNFFR